MSADEIKSAIKDSLSEGEQTPKAANETTLKKPSGLVPLKDHEDKIAAVGADWGRKYKIIEDENIVLKSQLATDQTLRKEEQDKRSNLEKQIDELSQDDPDKLRLTTKLRELDTLETRLRLDRDTITKEQETHRERIEKAEKFELGSMAKKIAGDYKDGNSDRLLAIALKLADRSEAELRAVADSIWEKKETDEKPESDESFTPDSGMTSGGSMNDRTFIKGIGSGDIDVKIKENYDRAKKLGLV